MQLINVASLVQIQGEIHATDVVRYFTNENSVNITAKEKTEKVK